MKHLIIGVISFCVTWYFLELIKDLATSPLKKQIELQKQTIYRLNNQLSKMDTLHDECFKMSDIRNAKHK